METVLNSTFCYELHQRTPDGEPPAVLWLIIGCKGNHSFRKNQIYSHLFLSSLLNALELTAASFVAPARKVRIRLRPSVEKYAVYVLLLYVDFSKTVKSEIEFKNFQEKKTINWDFLCIFATCSRKSVHHLPNRYSN